MRASIARLGFLKRNYDHFSNMSARAWSIGGLSGPLPEIELISFRRPDAINETKVMCDQDMGGFSTASLEAVPFPPDEIPKDHPKSTTQPFYGHFHGNISLELPPNRPDIERSGYAAWRTRDPGWTLFGRYVFQCDGHAFLALRVKADHSRYFVNVQTDSMVATDLYQHRLFIHRPGTWETVYIPFSEFVKTNLGRPLKTQSRMMQDNVKSVGLGLTDRVPGPFNLCIDRIWATSNRDTDD